MLVCESNSRQAERTTTKKKNERKSNIHVNELTNAGNIDAERKKTVSLPHTSRTHALELQLQTFDNAKKK